MPLLREGEKGYLDGYEVRQRQISQTQANYRALGANGTKGCASCNWFVSPNSCVLVSGDISPTGMSDYYSPVVEYESPPMRVIIVGEGSKEVPAVIETKVEGTITVPVVEPVGAKKSLRQVITSFLTNVSKLQGDKKADIQPFALFKEASGRLRFRTIWTNVFEDKAGEIFSTKAHKEYVEWVDKSGIYPELQVWHCGPGSVLGEVDFIDFVDGFCVASGLIHSEKESIALKLAELPLGVSHGFIGVKSASDTKCYDWYRTFEISLLPRSTEANMWTAYAFDEKEYSMGFDPKKMALLKSLGYPEAEITGMETQLKEAADKLKAAGIAWKDDTDAEQEKTEAEKAETAKKELSIVEQCLAGVKQATSDNIKIATVVADLSVAVKELKTEFAKSIDDRVADHFAARNGGVGAGAKQHVASQSNSNVVEGEAEAGLKNDKDWFGSDIIDNIFKAAEVGSGGVSIGTVGAPAGAGAGAGK